jgi:DNA polymerase I-like protein with 3'-5' exonuclease and polymerase domains
MRYLLDWAYDTERRLCGWNVPFDLSVMLAYGLEKEVFRLKYLDGLLLWKHLEVEPEYDERPGQKRPFGLKEFVRQFFPEHADYEAEIDFHDPDPAVRAKLHEYNIKDDAFTLRACKRLWAALTPRQQSAALFEADCLPMVADANLTGLLVDTFASHDISLRLTAQAAEKLASLAPHILPLLPPQTGRRILTDQQRVEEVIRSPQQLAVLLYGNKGPTDPVIRPSWGVTPLKKSDAGNWSTDKETLHELSFLDPRAKELRSYREALNQRTKFADGIIASVDYSDDCGHTHPMARVFGTYSGRFTYSSKQTSKVDRLKTFKTKPPRVERVKVELPIGFATHQMKRGAEFRDQIIAPQGCTIVEFDAAGQEYRWMAIASGDPTMLALCEPGEDAHSFMGARVEHGFEYRELIRLNHELDDWPADQITPRHKQAKQVRYAGKVSNLSLQYRTSAKRLMITARVDYGIDMTMPQAERNHGVYQRTYTQVPVYWKRQIELVMQTGYVETFAGRRVQVRGDWNGPLKWSMGSTAINYRIQGTGGDQKYLALSVTKDYCTDMGARFMLDLHDGLYWVVRDDRVHEFCATMKPMLDNLPYAEAWGFSPPIPLTFDCKAGKTWGSLKGVHL